MRFSLGKDKERSEGRRDGSLASRWPFFLRAVVILILVFWILWVMYPRLIAPPQEAPPQAAPSGMVTFSEPDALNP